MDTVVGPCLLKMNKHFFGFPIIPCGHLISFKSRLIIKNNGSVVNGLLLQCHLRIKNGSLLIRK
jgi:hypothetical protein